MNPTRWFCLTNTAHPISQRLQKLTPLSSLVTSQLPYNLCFALISMACQSRWWFDLRAIHPSHLIRRKFTVSSTNLPPLLRTPYLASTLLTSFVSWHASNNSETPIIIRFQLIHISYFRRACFTTINWKTVSYCSWYSSSKWWSVISLLSQVTHDFRSGLDFLIVSPDFVRLQPTWADKAFRINKAVKTLNYSTFYY